MSLLAWGEAWAKARGLWVENSAQGRKGWCVRAVDAGFQVCRGGGDGFDGWTTLTPAEFYLFALAHDDGRSARRVCPDCEAGTRTSKTRDGVRIWAGACPKCDALGYIDVPLTRVVCEAMPRPSRMSVNGAEPRTIPGSPAARTELLAAAYGLLVGWTDQERRHEIGGPYELRRNAEYITRHVFPGAHVVENGKRWGVIRGEPTPLRDYLESQGVRVAPDRTLALTPDLAQASGCKPHGDLGAALMVWLGGDACPACQVTSAFRGKLVFGACSVCHGEGTALAAHAVAQLEAETAQAACG